MKIGKIVHRTAIAIVDVASETAENAVGKIIFRPKIAHEVFHVHGMKTMGIIGETADLV